MTGNELVHSGDGTRREFDHGHLDVVQVAGHSIGRLSLEPGWRWSDAVKPLVKTDWCQVNHVGHVVAGRLAVQMEDGSTMQLNPGDSYRIAPGHDAWVEGDDTYVGIEFETLKDYAKPS